MTALSADKERYTKVGNIIQMPMAAVKIYKGAALMINTAGYVTNAAATNALKAAGFAVETIDNSGGSAGDLSIVSNIEDVIELDGLTGLTQADLGKTVYASDNATFTLTASNNIPMGTIVKFLSATKVELKPVFGTAAATI